MCEICSQGNNKVNIKTLKRRHWTSLGPFFVLVNFEQISQTFQLLTLTHF